MGKRLNLVGQRFNKLLVQAVTSDKTKGGGYYWICLCDCGKTCKVTTNSLRSGNNKGCGCLKGHASARPKDLTGRRFGRLLVLTLTHQDRMVAWNCLCDCGTKCVVKAHCLSDGATRSCGCLLKEVRKVFKPTHGLSRTRAYQNYHKKLYTATKDNRTPKWADLKTIEAIYAACPTGHHVDHIIPLRGTNVSGLHVAGNLQYLPAKENCRKKNRFEPLFIIKEEN